MKKLNTYIDYGKLVIVLLLFLLGSEPTKPALIFLLSALMLTCMIEGYLLHRRKILKFQYRQYLYRLERAVRDTVSDSEAA